MERVLIDYVPTALYRAVVVVSPVNARVPSSSTLSQSSVCEIWFRHCVAALSIALETFAILVPERICMKRHCIKKEDKMKLVNLDIVLLCMSTIL
jgi:hypothetical protein